MATKTVSISGEVLRWAREESGFTESELAERVERAETEDIKAWEAGTSQPTRGQFTKLVNVLKRPSAVFFLPEPPRAAGMPTMFRSSPALDGHKLGPDEALQVRWARRLQEIASWVLRDEGHEPARIGHYRVVDDPIVPADAERKKSDISVATQTAWRNPWEAFRAWRDYVEKCNVLVLQLEMGKNGIRGFGAWDDYAPLVAINTAYHPTARSFTLFHEFGHLLTRTNAACKSFIRSTSQDDITEKWCEQYAAAFLLPEEDLREVAYKHGVSPFSPTADPDKAKLIANRFKVSIRATAIRLHEVNLAKPGLYSAVAARFAANDWTGSSGGGGGQPATQRRIRQLGNRLTSTLVEAADRGRLTTRDLADFLRLKTGQLDDLRGLLVESH